MSKASEKRAKDLRNSLTERLNAKLRNFKNTYLGDFAYYRKKEILTKRDDAQFLIDNPLELAQKNQEIREHNENRRGRYLSEISIEGYTGLKNTVNRCDDLLKRENLNSLMWLNEANENFNTKLERVINKLVAFAMNTYKLKIEQIANNGSIFEFLISDDTMEVHARVIYAQGEIKAPHYRFIVTKRKK